MHMGVHLKVLSQSLLGWAIIANFQELKTWMIRFKDTHFPKDVILYAVYFYVRYAVSYRDLEEILAERGVSVGHAILNRWVIKYSASLALEAKKRKRSVATSWRMDESYIKVKGEWVYLYRAVDKFGDTIDFMLSEHRDEAAATAFFKKAINANRVSG
jgi:putative transposase